MDSKRTGRGAKPPAEPRRKASTTLLLIVAPLGLIFLPTTLLLAAGMVPTLVAWIADRDPEKTAPLTVGALNFVGCLPFLLRLWDGMHTLGAAAALLKEPLVWFGMYGAAAMGWGLYYSIPPVVAAWAAMMARRRIARIQAGQADLVAEWGEEVRGDPGAPAPAVSQSV